MSTTATHWVFWISLLLLMPLPVPGVPWGWLPAAYLALMAFQGSGWLYLLQAVFWGVLLWWLSRAYCYWSANWEAKIRGSVMALTVLSMLTVFASIPVYRLADQPEGRYLTFQWLYE